MICYKCKQEMKKIDDDYICEKCGVGSITLKSNTGYFSDIRDIKIADLEKQLAEKDKELSIIKQALKLATNQCDNYFEEQWALKKNMTLYDYFIEEAKKIEKGE